MQFLWGAAAFDSVYRGNSVLNISVHGIGLRLSTRTVQIYEEYLDVVRTEDFKNCFLANLRKLFTISCLSG